MQTINQIYKKMGMDGVMERVGPLLDKLLADAGLEIDDNGNVVPLVKAQEAEEQKGGE